LIHDRDDAPDERSFVFGLAASASALDCVCGGAGLGHWGPDYYPPGVVAAMVVRSSVAGSIASSATEIDARFLVSTSVEGTVSYM
jgi:hypothetical protein